MKNKDFLDDYVKELLNNSRAEEPVLSLDEVSKSLEIVVPKKVAKGWGFYLAGLSGMLGLFSLIFWFLLPQNKLENATPSIPKLPKLGFKESQNSMTALPQNTFPKTLFVPTIIMDEDSATGKEIRASRFVDVPFLVNNFDFEENEKELVLSYEELAKLGIYTDGCVLKYTNLKDSMFLDRKAIKKHEPSFFFYTEIQSNGGSYTLHNAGYKNDSLWNLYQDSLQAAYPMLIERFVTASTKGNNLYGLDSLYYIIEPKRNELIASHYVSEVKSLLVPVKVSLKAVANMYGKTDHDVIFWFKPNESFKECLRTKQVQWVNKNYSHFNEAAYQKLLDSIVVIKKQQIRKYCLDTAIVNEALSAALELDKKQLKSLGFRFHKTHAFSYKAIYNNRYFMVKRDLKRNHLLFNYQSNLTLKRLHNTIKTNSPAVFMMDKSLQPIHICKNVLSDSYKRRDEAYTATKEFINMLPNLVPIKFELNAPNEKSETYYFWFQKGSGLDKKLGIKP